MAIFDNIASTRSIFSLGETLHFDFSIPQVTHNIVATLDVPLGVSGISGKGFSILGYFLYDIIVQIAECLKMLFRFFTGNKVWLE